MNLVSQCFSRNPEFFCVCFHRKTRFCFLRTLFYFLFFAHFVLCSHCPTFFGHACLGILFRCIFCRSDTEPRVRPASATVAVLCPCSDFSRKKEKCAIGVVCHRPPCGFASAATSRLVGCATSRSHASCILPFPLPLDDPPPFLNPAVPYSLYPHTTDSIIDLASLVSLSHGLLLQCSLKPVLLSFFF